MSCVTRFVVLRGTTQQRNSFIPLEGEMVYDTDLNQLFIGDGITFGGNPLIGESEQSTVVRNFTGADIPKGKAVYISGASASLPEVELADKTQESGSSKTFGVTNAIIPNNGTASVVTYGVVTGLNTSSFTEGDSLWLSTNGDLQNTPAITPDHAVFIGYCLSSNPSTGEIFVTVQNGYEIEELHNVLVTNIQDRDIIVYDATLGYYVNNQLAEVAYTNNHSSLNLDDGSNPHNTTKADIGLNNVENTSDLDKPISTATQTALDLKYDASNPNLYETPTQLDSRDSNNRDRTNHTGTQLSSTISDFASSVLSTALAGLSTAANAVISSADTVLTALGKLQAQITQNKSDTDTHINNLSNPHSVTATQVGLGNVDNTSDLNKPISTATQTALDGKAPLEDYARRDEFNNFILNQQIQNGYLSTTTSAISFSSKPQVSSVAETSFGIGAGEGNINGNNTFIGYQAGNGSSQHSTVHIGYRAGLTSNGAHTIAIGREAALENLGSNTVFIGYRAAYQNTRSSIVCVGHQSGYLNTGTSLASFGYQSAYNNNGNVLTAIGSVSGFNNSGANSTFVGYASGYNNSGANSVGVGRDSIRDNTASSPTGVGYKAGQLNTGSFLAALGYFAAYQNQGNYLTGVGREAGRGNTGDQVTAIGYRAGYLNTGNQVVALGNQAGNGNSLSGTFIIANTSLPSFSSRAAAQAAITTANGASAGDTHLYYNSSTGAIEGIRL